MNDDETKCGHVEDIPGAEDDDVGDVASGDESLLVDLEQAIKAKSCVECVETAENEEFGHTELAWQEAAYSFHVETQHQEMDDSQRCLPILFLIVLQNWHGRRHEPEDRWTQRGLESEVAHKYDRIHQKQVLDHIPLQIKCAKNILEKYWNQHLAKNAMLVIYSESDEMDVAQIPGTEFSSFLGFLFFRAFY